MIHTVGCSLAAARLPDWVGFNPTRVGPGCTHFYAAGRRCWFMKGRRGCSPGPAKRGGKSDGCVTLFAGGLHCGNETC